MPVPATAVYIGGIACTPDGAVYVEPTGTASITGGNTWFVPSGGASGAAVSGGADTNENALATITIPPLPAGGRIRVRTAWTITNSVNNKIGRIRYSGASGTVFGTITTTTNAVMQIDCEIVNRAATNSQVGYEQRAVGSSTFNANGAALTASVDTSVATSIVITGQKASAGETITLEYYIVEILSP